MEFLALIAVMLVGFGGGWVTNWFFGSRQASEPRAMAGTRAQGVPPPAQIYDEGYRHGFLDGQESVKAITTAERPAPAQPGPALHGQVP
ncbi:hypothetical protein D477_014066, partial [Arthrobacter crystallopoietes BAB-32]